MSLRAKIVLILSGIVALYAGLDQLIQRLVVMRSFDALEEVEARKDIARVVEAFEQEIGALDERCLDWAAREDTRRYVERPDRAYEEAYLGLTSLQAHDLNLLFILDGRGMAVWSRIVDLETGDDVDLTGTLPKGGLAAHHPLLRRDQGHEKDGLFGLLLTERAPILVSSRPIVADGLEGEVRGWFVMGRFVSGRLVDLIRKRTAVAFTLEEAPRAGGAAGALWDRVAGAQIDRATRRPVPVVEARDARALHAYAALEDLKKAPGLMIRAEIPRDVTQKGATAVRYATLSTVAAGLLIMLVLLLVLQRTVLTPIAALTRHAVRIGRTDDFSVKLALDRRDEVGILSRELDDMMEKLDRSRRALADHARAAGMSEIATGVLHNVGNLLNSVNVSANLIATKAKGLGSEDLARALQVVAQHGGDLSAFVLNHPRGRHLQPLLEQLAQQLCAQRDDLLREIGSMNVGIEHIKELVQSQQSHAKGVTLLERSALDEVIATALGFCSQALAEPGGPPIEVAREIEELPPLKLDRHRVTEILVNLVQNAAQSVREARVPDPRIAVRAGSSGSDRIRIEVADNGAGIAPENLTRIFNHGFSTKAGGHGFGLHASANAATEMRGTLTARSDGPGRGATFALEFPIQEAALAVVT